MSNFTQCVEQLKALRRTFRPKGNVQETVGVMRSLIPQFIKYLRQREHMDKKMAKVTKKMVTAGKAIKKKAPAKAMKTLKKAEKMNVKLTKVDREVRDPKIKKCDKMMKKKAK